MLGHSGGRSAGHPEGQGAIRRNTPRERALIDPPWDKVVPRFPKLVAWSATRVGILIVVISSLTVGLGLGALLCFLAVTT
jgi:hypothetical protein